MTLTRKHPMKRGKGLSRGPIPRKARTPIKKANPERQAKRRKDYARKLAAYKRSEAYRSVEQRAGMCCEANIEVNMCGERYVMRCPASRITGAALTHHHKTYARFGGQELPEDVIVLCEYHNELAESQHPTRRRDYSHSRKSA